MSCFACAGGGAGPVNWYVRAHIEPDGTIRAEEIEAVCLNAVVEAPERLQQFLLHAVHDLDGLETALYYLREGILDEALQRMNMWHREFAHLGYRGWAESYFAEVQRKNQFTLPGSLSAEEQSYLEAWRSNVRGLIERSSRIVEEQNSAP
jgi:hypothetical protein